MHESVAPQLMSSHALFELHVMLHEWASVQSMFVHAPLLEHRIVQSKPAGHVTLSHGLPAEQVNMHCFVVGSHTSHPDAHGTQ